MQFSDADLAAWAQTLDRGDHLRGGVWHLYLQQQESAIDKWAVGDFNSFGDFDSSGDEAWEVMAVTEVGQVATAASAAAIPVPSASTSDAARLVDIQR